MYNSIIKIQIIAHPNSKNPRIEKDLLGVLHVYVNAPPLEGKANEAVIESLADHFKIAKGRLKLIKGERSKNKTLQID